MSNIIKKCRGAFYSLGCAGLAFPGASAVICGRVRVSSVLHNYGLDLLDISRTSLTKLESTQGTLIKPAMGIGKRSYHSKLLEAMDISTVKLIVQNMTLSLFNRISKVDCPET